MKPLRPMLILFTLAVFVIPTVTALAAYIGPNRTRTETTEVCTVVLWECKYVASRKDYRYRRVGDWSCSSESKPWESYPDTGPACSASTVGAQYWSRESFTTTTTVTYPEATISSALQNCTLSNGWCGITAPSLALGGIEPVNGYQITAIEGTLNGQPFSYAGATCNRALVEGNNAFTFWALSSFGDSSLMGTLTAKVDLTPPQIAPSVSGTVGANGWYVSTASVNASASDTLSGVQGTVNVSQNGGATWGGLPLTLADGQYSLELRAYDKAGNVRRTPLNIKVDTTSPNFTTATAGTLGLDGWYVSNAVATVSASDALSGVDRVEYDLNGTGWQSGSSIPTSDGINSISIRVFDKAGNTRNGSLTIKVDATPPTITPSVSGTVGINDWYVSNVSVSASASDAMSGVRGSVTISQNGGASWSVPPLSLTDGVHSLSFRVSDVAGNSSESVLTVKVDSTPPAFTTSTDGASGLDGWYVSDAVTTVSASDALSGVDRVEYDLNETGWQSGSSIPVSDGVNSISIRVSDRAGNTKYDTLTIKVDTTSPTIAPSVSGTAGANGWLVSPGVVSAAVNDGTSGVSGGVEVSFDGGSSWQASPITLADGVYTMTFRAYDKAGNEGRASLSVSVDTTPPVLDLTVSGTPGKNGWYVSDVQVTAPASDAVSGIDSALVRADGGSWISSLTLSDGVYRLDARAVDRAGNENTKAAELRIDTKAPSSAFSGFSNNEIVKGDITLTGQALDAGSGVELVEISLDGGTTWLPADLAGDKWALHWDTASVSNGVYSVLVRATDVAGNTESPTALTLTVDNLPPKVKITDWWWIWSSGEYKISPNTFPVQDVTVVISDPEGRWAPVKLTYNPELSSSIVKWDRHFGDVLAPSGNYRVVVTACDIHSNCASDQGIIKVPFFDLVSITSLLSPQVVPTTEPVPTQAPPPTPKVEPPRSEADPSLDALGVGQGLLRDLSWVVFALFIAVLYFGAVALLDPRPEAINALARTINQFNKERQ